MKKEGIKKSLWIFPLLIAGLIATGCGSKSGPNAVTDPVIKDTTKVEGPPIPRHGVKPLDLGVAESFAIIAYTSVASTPTSSVKGKVGLKPGARNLITLDSAEVEGGSDNIYSGDDSGDKGIYLTLAREEIIASYRDAVSRPTDKDKLEAYGGHIGGKILPPGVYKWNNGVSVESDLTFEGNSKDVWIFQIEGNVNVSSSVHMRLAGGAKARNVFWQISGKVNLESNSETIGTMISQLAFDMKTSAKLNGRAFVKNGKLSMDHATIEIPQ